MKFVCKKSSNHIKWFYFWRVFSYLEPLCGGGGDGAHRRAIRLRRKQAVKWHASHLKHFVRYRAALCAPCRPRRRRWWRCAHEAPNAFCTSRKLPFYFGGRLLAPHCCCTTLYYIMLARDPMLLAILEKRGEVWARLPCSSSTFYPFISISAHITF